MSPTATTPSATPTSRLDRLHRAYFLFDRSASTDIADAGVGGNLRRFDAMKESGLGFVRDLNKKGIAVTAKIFASRVKTFPNATAEELEAKFMELRPAGGTATDVALKEAADEYFAARAADPSVGSCFVVIYTDGQPDNKPGLAQAIVDITKRIQSREEFGILFCRVGKGQDAIDYLEKLDNQLTSAGAEQDIVAVEALEDLEDFTVADLVDKAYEE